MTKLMKFTIGLFFAFALIVGSITTPAFAGDADPLFVNLTTDDAHRATMAIAFGKSQLERGHPLTIWLTDKGVLVGSKSNAINLVNQQKMLAELIGKGAVVLICPFCLEHYGVNKADLLPGIKLGNPELTGSALFKGNTKSLTW